MHHWSGVALWSVVTERSAQAPHHDDAAETSGARHTTFPLAFTPIEAAP